MPPPTKIVGFEPMRMPSPLLVCDHHRGRARAIDVLGPSGYELLCAAFKVTGKQPPILGDLGIDFQSLDG
jgi:hypothetical protein